MGMGMGMGAWGAYLGSNESTAQQCGWVALLLAAACMQRRVARVGCWCRRRRRRAGVYIYMKLLYETS
jgi:hypothetical protein